VDTPPLLSTAAQNDVDGHETPSSCAVLAVATLGDDQRVVPVPAGVRARPPESTAAQNVLPEHATP